MKQTIAQWFAAIAVGVLAAGGVALAASGLFSNCNNCTINVSAPVEAPQMDVPERLGSVNQANEYHATTTFAGSLQDIFITTSSDVFAQYRGSLGSVVITKVGGGTLDIYDATTSIYSQRASSMTTNTIRLASFPATAATGTYVFDEVYYNGLLAVFTGVIPTTTITYR